MQKRNALMNICVIVALSIAVAIGLNNLLMIMNLAQYSERYQKAAEMLYAPAFAEQILYSGILIPVLEELLFRGVLFRVLRRWLPFVWAMLISAIAFGVYHGNLVQFVYAGLCGMLFVYLYETYDSILAPILSHMVMNITACTLTKADAFVWMLKSAAAAWVSTGICIAITAVLFWFVHKRYILSGL